jgi:hypothetical protein
VDLDVVAPQWCTCETVKNNNIRTMFSSASKQITAVRLHSKVVLYRPVCFSVSSINSTRQAQRDLRQIQHILKVCDVTFLGRASSVLVARIAKSA